MENKQASFGAAFGEMGGGVYAMSMELEGVYVWFWSVRFFLPSFCFVRLTRLLNLASGHSIKHNDRNFHQHDGHHFMGSPNGGVPCFGM